MLELPSGFVARIRSVQPDVFFRAGKIPDALTPVVVQMFEGMPDELEMTSVADLKPYTDLVNVLCQSIMVEPKLVEKPEADDEIGFDHLEWPDKQLLLTVIGRSTKDIELFRDQQKDDVENVDTGKGDGAAAK